MTYVDSAVFDKVNAVAGTEIPKEFPSKYRKGLSRSGLFNGTQSFSTEELSRTQKRYEIEMATGPTKIFGDYIGRGNIIVSNLVSHPFVPNRQRFGGCDIILQRAVLVSNPPTQTIYLRSYFHSKANDDAKMFVNFVPRGGLSVEYESDTIWFPLRLTSLITEPASYVVLDVLTPRGVAAESVPKAFHASDRGKVTLNGQTYVVTRLEAVLSSKEEWSDLTLKGK